MTDALPADTARPTRHCHCERQHLAMAPPTHTTHSYKGHDTNKHTTQHVLASARRSSTTPHPDRHTQPTPRRTAHLLNHSLAHPVYTASRVALDGWLEHGRAGEERMGGRCDESVCDGWLRRCVAAAAGRTYLARCLIFLRFLFRRRMRFFLHLPLILNATSQHNTHAERTGGSAVVGWSDLQSRRQVARRTKQAR